jgi:hypothetical protein
MGIYSTLPPAEVSSRVCALVDFGTCQHAAQIKVKDGARSEADMGSPVRVALRVCVRGGGRPALGPAQTGEASLAEWTIRAVQSLRKQFHS